MLLFQVHLHRVLMRVAMKASAKAIHSAHIPPPSGIVTIHLMPRVSYHCTFLRKCLERVSRNEPSGLDVVFGKQLQQSANSNCAGEETLETVSAYNSLRHRVHYEGLAHLWKYHS